MVRASGLRGITTETNTLQCFSRALYGMMEVRVAVSAVTVAVSAETGSGTSTRDGVCVYRVSRKGGLRVITTHSVGQRPVLTLSPPHSPGS